MSDYEITEFYSGTLYGTEKRSVVIMKSGNIHAFKGDLPKCSALCFAKEKDKELEIYNLRNGKEND